jgi:protein CpxP
MSAGRAVAVAAIAVVCGLGRADAQQQLALLAKATPQQRADIQTAFMERKLGLSADERTKVAAINLTYAEKSQPVLTGSDGSLAKMRALKRLDADKDTALKAVLTPAQFQTLQASKDELRAHLFQSLGGSAPGQQ